MSFKLSTATNEVRKKKSILFPCFIKFRPRILSPTEVTISWELRINTFSGNQVLKVFYLIHPFSESYCRISSIKIRRKTRKEADLGSNTRKKWGNSYNDGEVKIPERWL